MSISLALKGLQFNGCPVCKSHRTRAQIPLLLLLEHNVASFVERRLGHWTEASPVSRLTIAASTCCGKQTNKASLQPVFDGGINTKHLYVSAPIDSKAARVVSVTRTKLKHVRKLYRILCYSLSS